MSGMSLTLPSSGFFSVVWRGRWRGQTVAIKELNSITDRTLFIKEVEIWRKLKDSSFILPFLGASSTTGPLPWFLVSPYSQCPLSSTAAFQLNKL